MPAVTSIAPDDCVDMKQIRAQVNQLDAQIIALLGERLKYVHAAVRFKPDEESIRRPDHWDHFFAARKTWAQAAGYPTEVIEDMYRRLYDYTIVTQLDLHAKKPKG
jgi:isochorismate pyruvate lyase